MSPSSSPRSVSGTSTSFLPAARSAIVRVRSVTGRAINRVRIIASVMAMPISAIAPRISTTRAEAIAASWLSLFFSICAVSASLMSRRGSTAALVSTALPAFRASAAASSRWPACTIAIRRSLQSARHFSVSSRDVRSAASIAGSVRSCSSSTEVRS